MPGMAPGRHSPLYADHLSGPKHRLASLGPMGSTLLDVRIRRTEDGYARPASVVGDGFGPGLLTCLRR